MLTQSTSEIIKRVRKIEIFTRNLVNEVFTGEYHSMFRGQGLEFMEVREYQPGDNYRDIDWNVSARFGIPFIKKYQETRELNVLFLVDCSGSQNFGTRNVFKKERIAELTALLSFSALSNHDKIGMVLFSSKIEKYLPPRKGRNYALQILRDILFFEPEENGTSLNTAFEYTIRILKKKSIIFVLSDFFDKDYGKSLKILARKHDVIALQVLDSSELELPNAGSLRLKDPETGEQIIFSTRNMNIRNQYKNMIKAEQERLHKTLKQYNIDLVTIKTDEPYIKILRSFFEKRAALNRHR